MEGLTDRTSMILRNLTTGDKLQFRVRAYNMAGASGPATLAQPVTIREIMRKRLPGSIRPPAHFCTGTLVLNKALSKTFNSDFYPFLSHFHGFSSQRTSQNLAAQKPPPDPRQESRRHGQHCDSVPGQVLSSLQVICRPLLSRATMKTVLLQNATFPKTGQTTAQGDMEQRGRASEQLVCQREEQRRGHHPLHPQD